MLVRWKRMQRNGEAESKHFTYNLQSKLFISIVFGNYFEIIHKEKTKMPVCSSSQFPECTYTFARKPSLTAVQISLSCLIPFVPLLHFSDLLLFLFYGCKPSRSWQFLSSHHPFLRGFSLPLRLTLHRQLLCHPPTQVPVNCAKSRHSRCHRYLSITLSPFSPSAKIKFAGSRAKQMLPLPWPLVALSQLWVSNNSRTLNSGLLVLPEDDQLNKSKLNEKISCPVILYTVLLLKNFSKTSFLHYFRN